VATQQSNGALSAFMPSAGAGKFGLGTMPLG
jgi:hypothetical protein